MHLDDVIAVLDECPVFDDFSREEKGILAAISQYVRLSKGEKASPPSLRKA